MSLYNSLCTVCTVNCTTNNSVTLVWEMPLVTIHQWSNLKSVFGSLNVLRKQIEHFLYFKSYITQVDLIDD